MPRVIHDLEYLKKDAMTMKETLNQIRNNIEGIEQKTEKSVSSLSEVDKIKSRMEDR